MPRAARRDAFGLHLGRGAALRRGGRHTPCARLRMSLVAAEELRLWLLAAAVEAVLHHGA
eukprot:866605-Alexandrium_andersonii.AAC.1